MALKDRTDLEEDWRYKKVSLRAAEDALRMAIQRVDEKQNAFGHLLCVALIGICREMQAIRHDTDLIASRLSIVARELQIDPDEWRNPRLEND